MASDEPKFLNQIPPADEFNEEWLENFYKECGREVTLAYTTLNQMKNWAMIVAAAAISGLGFGTGSQAYPNEQAYTAVAVVFTFILRFYFRAILCYINLSRWNTLQSACLKAYLEPASSDSAAKSELRKKINDYYYLWQSPIDRKTQLLSNLKLGFALLLGLPLFFLVWGVVVLWRAPLVLGMTVFAVGSICIEFWDFGTSTYFDRPDRGRRSRSTWSHFPLPQSRYNFVLYWGLLVVLSVSAASVQYFRLANQRSKRQAAQTESHKTIITSDPTGARLYVDGTYEGLTPFSMHLNPGSRNITLQNDGYNTSTIKLSMGGVSSEVLSVTMISSTSGKPNHTVPRPSSQH
jgi:hypothetical protein